MGMRTPKDINSAISVGATPAIPPQSTVAATINGSGIDRVSAAGAAGVPFASAAFVVQTGTATGGPTTQSTTAKIQDSADNVTFADYVPPTLSVAPTCVVSANNGQNKIGVDLSGARQYVRVTLTQAFTGGASPAQLVAAMLVLGGAEVEPAGL